MNPRDAGEPAHDDDPFELSPAASRWAGPACTWSSSIAAIPQRPNR